MGLGDWLRRALGGRARSSAMVPFFDVETGRVVQIPVSELRPGALQVQREGVEGLVWVLAEQIQEGEIKHPPFDESVRSYIRRIQVIFDEQRPLTFEEWEEGFRRDAHPEREIAIWSHAADVYSKFAETEPSPERRADVYRCVVTCLVSDPDSVWHVLKMEYLTRAEAEQIVTRFYGKGG